MPAAIRLSRATLRNIHENLFWAFIYNIIGIPLAAGVWIPLFGWKLNPMFGAAAMSLSSFCVVSNALRLNLFDIRNTKKDRKCVAKGSGPDGDMTAKGSCPVDGATAASMEKTIQVKGMMCGHCEAHVKKALEELTEVDEATADFQSGVATVVLLSLIHIYPGKDTVHRSAGFRNRDSGCGKGNGTDVYHKTGTGTLRNGLFFYGSLYG